MFSFVVASLDNALSSPFKGMAIAYGFTPTPSPSPRGGGGLAGISAWRQSSTGLLGMAAAKSPSPLWGGVRGGGIALSRFQDRGLDWAPE